MILYTKKTRSSRAFCESLLDKGHREWYMEISESKGGVKLEENDSLAQPMDENGESAECEICRRVIASCNHPDAFPKNLVFRTKDGKFVCRRFKHRNWGQPCEPYQRKRSMARREVSEVTV
jgi:hypothetical protein